MSDQPIPGTLAWMAYTMAKVHPVYDNTVILTSENPSQQLTDDSGVVLVSDVTPPLGNLVRWM